MMQQLRLCEIGVATPLMVTRKVMILSMGKHLILNDGTFLGVESVGNIKIGVKLIGRLSRAMDIFADNLRDEILEAFDNLAEGNLTFEATGLIREPLAKTSSALCDLVNQFQDSLFLF